MREEKEEEKIIKRKTEIWNVHFCLHMMESWIERQTGVGCRGQFKICLVTHLRNRCHGL